MCAASDHMKSMQCAKSLADAACQSAKQCLSTRNALRQARLDEQKEIEKETIRLAKAAEAAEKKAQNQKKKDEEKDRKRIEKDNKKKKDEEAKARNKDKEKTDDPEKQKGRRRGRGQDELVEGEDPACLTSRFNSFEVPVLDSQPAFVQFFVHGIPCIWRARRSPLKKVVQTYSPSMPSKELNSAATLLQAEWKAFLSDFAAEVADDTTDKIKKKNRACSAEVQEHRAALSMDNQVQSFLESELVNPTLDLEPCLVMEEAVLKDYMEQFKYSMIETDAIAEEVQKRTEHEISMYETLHMVAMPKGKNSQVHLVGCSPTSSINLKAQRLSHSFGQLMLLSRTVF